MLPSPLSEKWQPAAIAPTQRYRLSNVVDVWKSGCIQVCPSIWVCLLPLLFSTVVADVAIDCYWGRIKVENVHICLYFARMFACISVCVRPTTPMYLPRFSVKPLLLCLYAWTPILFVRELPPFHISLNIIFVAIAKPRTNDIFNSNIGSIK